jgi:Type I phosphodiesterase / nucleotide pyrophosphatase
MSNSNRGIRKAFVLWLSGIRLADIRLLAEVESLLKNGALVELDPSPITGPQAQYYQVFSGRLPAHFGFFDTLMPVCHLARPQQGLNGYTVVEEHTGRDAPPQMFPDLLRAAGWAVEYKETSLDGLSGCVQGLAQTEANGPQATCKIVRSELGVEGAEFSAYTRAISEALRAARAWVGETGLLALLSDIQPAPVNCFVNVNNFLAEMELIERDEQDGLINWTNSLAYYTGHGQVWVNLLGRDPQGAVHPQDEYEEVCATLVKALPAKLRDTATGAQVIERVYRKEELYSDEYLFCAPDLVIVFKPGYAPSPQSTRLGFDEAIFTAPTAGMTSAAGIHPSMVSGFLLATAPVLSPGAAALERAPLTAAVPSLLHALDIEYAGMDGPAVSALFAPSYLESHPIRTHAASQELSEEDEELVINRLRDLGYV